MTDSTLLALLGDLERGSRLAVVRFTDGEAYDLRFISTAHAEAGGDIVAEVVRTISSNDNGAVSEGAFINFYLADVESVVLDGACVFGPEGAA